MKNNILYNSSGQFIENLEIDAKLVLSGMNGGIDEIMDYAFSRLDIFTDTKIVTDRCDWLKSQSREYIKKVSEYAQKLETN